MTRVQDGCSGGWGGARLRPWVPWAAQHPKKNDDVQHTGGMSPDRGGQGQILAPGQPAREAPVPDDLDDLHRGVGAGQVLADEGVAGLVGLPSVARSGAPALANSSLGTTASMVDRPLALYWVGHLAQIQPPSNSLAVHSSAKRPRSSPPGA